MSQRPSIKLLNEKVLPAKYAADELIQRVIALVKNHNKTGISRLPSPWRETFQSFSIDSKEFLYMDNRLVIPQSFRPMIMCSLPEASEQNEKVALDFARPFQNAKKGKKYILASIDHYSGRPEAKFLHHLRGNGKKERLIRTINERLRTNKQIILSKGIVGNFILIKGEQEKRG